MIYAKVQKQKTKKQFQDTGGGNTSEEDNLNQSRSSDDLEMAIPLVDGVVGRSSSFIPDRKLRGKPNLNYTEIEFEEDDDG